MKQALEDGNQSASYSLGKFYLNEAYEIISNTKNLLPEQITYISNNCDNAMNYLLQANQNNENVQFTLGQLYLVEQSSFYNSEKAISIFTQLAEKNNDHAQYNLGKLYLFGNKQIKPNKDLAIKWLTLAKENGNKNAATLLQEQEKYLQSQAIVKAYSLVVNIFNNMNEANSYQNELITKARSHSKQAMREELIKQGKDLSNSKE